MRARAALPAVLAAAALSFAGGPARGFGKGVSGSSGKTPETFCDGCHSANGTPAPGPHMLDGPPRVAAGETGRYTLTVEGLAAGAGFDIAASGGALATIGQDVASQIVDGEVTHTSSWPRRKSVSLDFAFMAPAEAGTVTLFYAVLSADGTGGITGDATAHGTLQVEIGPPPDLAGADFSGVDLALVDLASSDLANGDSGAPMKPKGNEPRWGLSCALGLARRAPADRCAPLPMLAAVIAIVLRARRRSPGR